MNVSDTLQKIKALFAEPEMPPVAEPAAPVAYTLADGTEVEISALEVGGVVTIQGMPAPEGDHELSDGTMLSVDANGVITALTPVVVEEVAPVDPAAEMAAFRAEFSTLKTEFANHKQSFSTLQSDFTQARETITKQDQAIQGLLSVVEQLSKTPVADPVEAPRSAFAKVDFEAREQKITNIASAMKAIRNK
jgi:hypothetical protein